MGLVDSPDAGDGQALGGALRRDNVPASAPDQALRAEGVLDHGDVHRAFLETDGTISVIRRKAD